MMKWHVQLSLLAAVSVLALGSCKDQAEAGASSYEKIEGNTMGTTYVCQYSGPLDKKEVSKGIDSLLALANATASTYIPSSLISKFNQSTTECIDKADPQAYHMRVMIGMSRQIHKTSDGYFDPTLMPLVNLYGFGYADRSERRQPTGEELAAYVELVGLDQIADTITGDDYCLMKSDPRQELDLSAIAKGYAVDMIGQYLDARGAEAYYINIGGEVLVYGDNPTGQPWRLGINYPDAAAELTELYAIFSSSDHAMATSGNYRNYYAEEGRQIVHTIDPTTGLATPSDLLSVTIIGDRCGFADAIATACMAMGYTKARTMMNDIKDYMAFYVYVDEDGNIRHDKDEGLNIELINHDE